MPIFEFQCLDCKRRFSTLVGVTADSVEPACPRCQGMRLRKLVSRFSRPRSEDERLDALGDPASMGDVDENDPRSMARWMKRMGQEMGEDLGDDFEEALEQVEAEEDGEPAGADDVVD